MENIRFQDSAVVMIIAGNQDLFKYSISCYLGDIVEIQVQKCLSRYILSLLLGQ